MKNPKVVMMGLGYIGLPTAALIAGNEINVLGVDISKSVVETINKGKIHIIEPDLDGLVHKVVHEQFLKASLEPEEADVFLIAVPTPFKKDHEPDLKYVESATKMILPFLREGNTFIIESTSPVGTTQKMADLIFSERPELKDKIYIAYCPERVLPGQVLYELEHNDRVIGGINAESTQKSIDFYSLFVKGELHKTNAKTAEMCKLVENSYRDVNIAFANELSVIAEKSDIDVYELIQLTNKHPRVNILQPGPGVGGHCIAVDPWFLIHDFEDAKLIEKSRNINIKKESFVIEKIQDAEKEFEKQYNKKPVIACFGLAYKPDIDDLRESPALRIVKKLIENNYNVVAVEPNIKDLKDVKIMELENALQADIFVFLVAHREFKELDLNKKYILDFCGINSK